MSPLPPDDPAVRLFLRHTLATLAYRAGKTVRGTPEAFGAHRVTPDSPSSHEILGHMGDLMKWVLTTVQGKPVWTVAASGDAPLAWAAQIDRFFAALQALDDHLASTAPIQWDPGALFQGGIADALTHTGQLAMLRRLAGYKMKGESYAQANIAIGRVGLDQPSPDPGSEFD